jgi:hypothetical protein
MHDKTYASSTDEFSEMINSDQEIITVNKFGLINDILNIFAFGLFTGIIIGGSIMHLIICFN